MNFKNTRQKPQTVKKMTVVLRELKDTKYTKEDLVEVLNKITFNLININLSTKKTNIGIDGIGYTAIGFVNGFNKDTSEFEVVVFNNRVEAVEKLGKIAIVPRAFTNKEGKITKIIGLDIEPVQE